MKNLDLEKEKSLLLNAKSNKSKFSDLYNYYLNDVYRFSFSLVGNQHDAEDISSQTFVEMYKCLDKLEWKGISMKYWLFKTARNLSLRSFAKTKRSFNPESFDGYEEAREECFENIVLDKDELNLVINEIKDLKPNERELINMRVWEDMTFEEIAEITDEKSITVRQRFYRAVEKVKVSLSQKNYKRFASFGAIMGALSQTGSASAFTANSIIAANIASGIAVAVPVTVLTTASLGTVLATTKAFIATNAAATAVVATTTTAAVAGGGYIVYDNYQKETSKTAEVVEFQPSPEPTKFLLIDPINSPTSTPTATPTQTPTPVPTLASLTYRDAPTRITFSYREDMQVKVTRNEVMNGSLITRRLEISKNGSLLILEMAGGIGCTAFTPTNVRVNRVIPSIMRGKYYGRTFANGVNYYGSYSSSINGRGYFKFCEMKDIIELGGNDTGGYWFTKLVLRDLNDLEYFDSIIQSISRY